MTMVTERPHPGEFILSEPAGHYARENITVLSGEGVLKAGTVIGQAAGAVTQAFAGTGNGVLTMDVTTPILAGAQIGDYKVTFVGTASDLGDFIVTDPNGRLVGGGRVGATFANQLKFAIADGATDFGQGAQFTLSVAAGKWRSADPTNADGSNVARGILLAEVDATSADAKAVGFVRGPSEVIGGCLVYDAAVDDASKKATKIAELAAAGIIVR